MFFLLYRHGYFTGKYTTRKIHTKLHPGPKWRSFHILTSEDIDDVISRTLIRKENGSFIKRSSNRRNLKTPAFRFRFENGDWRHDGVTIILWFPWPSFPQTYIQSEWCCCVFKFLRRRKHLMGFQIPTPQSYLGCGFDTLLPRKKEPFIIKCVCFSSLSGQKERTSRGEG